MVGPSALVSADSVEDASTSEGRHKLLNEESQKSTTDRCQVEVVNHEEAVEYKRRSVSHEFSTTKDYNVVQDQRGDRLLQGRGDGLADLELEVFWRITEDGRVEIAKHRPDSDTKWSVECWQTNLDALEKVGHRSKRMSDENGKMWR